MVFNWDWTKLNPGSKNSVQVSPAGHRDSHARLIIRDFPGTLGGGCIRSGTARTGTSVRISRVGRPSVSVACGATILTLSRPF